MEPLYLLDKLTQNPNTPKIVFLILLIIIIGIGLFLAWTAIKELKG